MSCVNMQQGLLLKYNNSIINILNTVFPSLVENATIMSSFTSASQKVLWNLLHKFFPTLKMYENYRHPGILTRIAHCIRYAFS